MMNWNDSHNGKQNDYDHNGCENQLPGESLIAESIIWEPTTWEPLIWESIIWESIIREFANIWSGMKSAQIAGDWFWVDLIWLGMIRNDSNWFKIAYES